MISNTVATGESKLHIQRTPGVDLWYFSTVQQKGSVLVAGMRTRWRTWGVLLLLYLCLLFCSCWTDPEFRGNFMLIFPKRSSDLTRQQNFFHFTAILSYWIFYVTSPVLLSPTPFGLCSFRISSCSVLFLSLRSWSRLVSPPAGHKYTNLKFGAVG